MLVYMNGITTYESGGMQHFDDIKVQLEYQTAISRSSLAEVHIVDDSTAIALEFLRMRETIRQDRIGARADRFIGFLSGRLKVTPPQWWSEQFSGGIVQSNRSVGFCFRLADEPWHTSEQGARFGGVTYIEMKGDKLEISTDEAVVTLLRTDFKQALTQNRTIWKCEPTEQSDGAVAATIYKGKFAVAFKCKESGRGTGPQRFFFGDVKSGKPEWNAPLLHGDINGMSSGDPKGTYTEIIMDDSRVFVFGSHCIGMSLQVFDKANGKCLAIFVTRYLQALSLDSTGNVVLDRKEKD
jgi:hypothetical protein